MEQGLSLFDKIYGKSDGIVSWNLFSNFFGGGRREKMSI